jgi:hydrogenase maturation protease
MMSLQPASTEPVLPTLVLGIGNAWRGDDAAGLLAAHALRVRKLPGVTVVESNTVDPSLIELWQGVDRLIVVDAVASGAAPGTVHRFDLSRETLPATLSFCSTHAFDLAALFDLARALGRLPRQVWVFGIEARDFTHGHPVSEEVMLGLGACVETIASLL